MLAGCGSAAPAVAPGQGTLRVVSGNVPRTLNPILASQTVEANLARLTTDILVSVDPLGRFVPKLAREVPTLANGGISADGRTIVYHLRSGVRWHDGAPFTSRDVKFTVDAIMNPKNDVTERHGYDQIARVDTPDPLTVVFRLRRPFAPFVATIFGESDAPMGILPAHLLSRYADLNNVAYNSAPVGTGPFKFVRWLRGDRIEYERNDAYFLGRPKIARIDWRLVPDENTEVTMMRTHEADWFFEASVAVLPQLQRVPEVRTILQPYNGYAAVMFNTRRGAIANRRVRRAIAMAIDARSLATDLTHGAAQPAVADLPSFMWAFDPRLHHLPYDPVRARAELGALGYTPSHPLVLDLAYEQSDASKRALSVQVQAQLHAVGVEVHPRAQLSSVIYAGYGAGGTFMRGKYDIAVTGWTAGIDPDDSSQLTCASLPPNGTDTSFYCSPAMDAAQSAALTSYAIPVRKRAYATIERLLIDDVPYDYLWWPRNIQAIGPALTGFDPNPVVEAWNVATWSLTR